MQNLFPWNDPTMEQRLRGSILIGDLARALASFLRAGREATAAGPYLAREQAAQYRTSLDLWFKEKVSAGIVRLGSDRISPSSLAAIAETLSELFSS